MLKNDKYQVCLHSPLELESKSLGEDCALVAKFSFLDIFFETLLQLYNPVSQREGRYIFSFFEVFSQMQICQKSVCFIRNSIMSHISKVVFCFNFVEGKTNPIGDCFRMHANCKTIGDLSGMHRLFVFSTLTFAHQWITDWNREMPRSQTKNPNILILGGNNIIINILGRNITGELLYPSA